MIIKKDQNEHNRRYKYMYKQYWSQFEISTILLPHRVQSTVISALLRPDWISIAEIISEDNTSSDLCVVNHNSLKHNNSPTCERWILYNSVDPPPENHRLGVKCDYTTLVSLKPLRLMTSSVASLGSTKSTRSHWVLAILCRCRFILIWTILLLITIINNGAHTPLYAPRETSR